MSWMEKNIYKDKQNHLQDRSNESKWISSNQNSEVFDSDRHHWEAMMEQGINEISGL